MATAENTHDEPLLRGRRRQDLQEILGEVGLAVEYWLPKLQEDLGVSNAQALQYLQEKDSKNLKSQVQYPWEKRALKKLLNLSYSNSIPELQESPGLSPRSQQKQAEQALQELRDLLSEGRHRQEEAVRRREAELRQAMEIPEEYWPKPEKPLREVMESMQRQLNVMEQTLSHRQNLPVGDLVRWASGGLALQGIYKTCHENDLIKRRERLLCVPKEFTLCGPEQGTRMETKEFTSSQAQSMFTETMEKLGFSVTTSGKGGGWGFSFETGINNQKHSESKEIQQASSEHSYFCSTKFNYIPLASCHFSIDQLQFSEAALQELKCIEDLLDQTADLDRTFLLRQRTANFFHRFGSHANQGPLHLGGIYWWKAVSEGFQSKQLADVKKQAAEALDIYVSGSYSGFGVKAAAGTNVSNSHSKTTTQKETFRNLQTKVELSMAQTGGPPEAEDPVQWKAGLVASNQTWCVIDRGLQLVPIWDIILSSHRGAFKDPLRLAKCLTDNYTSLTGLTAQIQCGEELFSENFIFSFRNTQEVMAMNKLETMYNQWTWELRSHVLDLQNQLNNQIQNGKIQTLKASTIEAPITEKYENIKQELEKYFNEGPDSEILVQWKTNFEGKLLILKETFILDTRRKAHELIHLQKGKERLDEEKTAYENEELEKSQNVALTVKGEKQSEEELREKFNQVWKKFIDEVSVTHPQVAEPNIHVDAESILWEYFKKEKNITETLKGNSKNDFKLDYGKHVKHPRLFFPLVMTPQLVEYESIRKINDRIFLRFYKTMSSIQNQKHDYNQNDFHKILRIIEEEVISTPTNSRYIFTSEYKIELALHLFQHASKHFMEIHKEFKRVNDPVNYLESKKDDFFKCFKISQGTTSIASFVDFLWHKLNPAVSTTI